MSTCSGHFGHIELASPMYHIGFLGRVKKILECVCWHCKRLRVVDAKVQQIKLHGPKRLRKISLSSARLVVGKNRETFAASRAWQLLSQIPEDVCKQLGVFQPQHLVITVLPVPPPCVRPSVSIDASGRGEDDLTYKLADVIKINVQLERNQGRPMQQQYDDLLQYHITTYFDNDITGQPVATQKSGRPLKSLMARLKGKEGRLRGNIMGKRVNFAARTVITGDPAIGIEQVGVPERIARTLVFPENVNSRNLEQLQAMVNRGPEHYPSAKYVISSGVRVDLRFCKEAPRLQVGDIVERHLMDNDPVLFNRQPTLHKMSMMCHRTKIMPFNTFRLNLSVTTPYNADFDGKSFCPPVTFCLLFTNWISKLPGDEMNLHMPMSWQTRTEIWELSQVPKMIVSPQSNKPVMGIVQDSLCGVYMLTQRDTFLTVEDAMQNLFQLEDHTDPDPERSVGIKSLPIPCILKPQKLYSGKQLMSLVLPKDVNFAGYHSQHPDGERTTISPGDTRVIVRNGELLAGILCKKTVGTSQSGLVHVIWQDCGPEACRRFFNDTQKIVTFWLQNHGFSTGVGDMILAKPIMAKVRDIVDSARKRTQEIISQSRVPAVMERRINMELNKARDTAGTTVLAEISRCNNVNKMVKAGSKGSMVNISQMSACVGQRIPFGFRDRTLPHFFKYDNSPEARGFVSNSYIRGLTPHEFFFHAMGGREGLIDTAVKTADTGYIQRRLIKALEDLSVKYDHTVRNANNQVIQFVYGEDGMDGTAVERQSLDLSDLKERYWIPDAPEEYEQLVKDRDALLATGIDFSTVVVPVNMRRLVRHVQETTCSNQDQNSQNRYADIARRVSETLDSVFVSCFPDQTANATWLFRVLARSVLASKRIVHEYKLSDRQVDTLLELLKKRFQKGVVCPGEMVGVVAAQSIGENVTQLCLNTFHFAGVSSKNVTLGVPRLKELINVVKNIKTPGMRVYLSPDHSSAEGARQVLNKITRCTLRDVVTCFEILYDPCEEKLKNPHKPKSAKSVQAETL
ncbi:DNA-directed RNA polymerase II subunit rpb1, partial [Quaeritorhiza haematococci]